MFVLLSAGVYIWPYQCWFHFPCNKEDRLVLSSFFSKYNLYSKKYYKPAKGGLSSNQLFVTSLHIIFWTITMIHMTVRNKLVDPGKTGDFWKH